MTDPATSDHDTQAAPDDHDVNDDHEVTVERAQHATIAGVDTTLNGTEAAVLACIPDGAQMSAVADTLRALAAALERQPKIFVDDDYQHLAADRQPDPAAMSDGGHPEPPQPTGRGREREPAPEDACIECGTYAAFRCGCCGFPLCGRHHEVGGGFCSRYLSIGAIQVCAYDSEVYVSAPSTAGPETPDVLVEALAGRYHLPDPDADGDGQAVVCDATVTANGLTAVPVADATERDVRLCAQCEQAARDELAAHKQAARDDLATDGGTTRPQPEELPHDHPLAGFDGSLDDHPEHVAALADYLADADPETIRMLMVIVTTDDATETIPTWNGDGDFEQLVWSQLAAHISHLAHAFDTTPESVANHAVHVLRDQEQGTTCPACGSDRTHVDREMERAECHSCGNDWPVEVDDGE